MSAHNTCLIGFNFVEDTQVAVIKEMLGALTECGDIEKCSTVYKQTLQLEGKPAITYIRFVIHFSTYLSAEQMIYLLDNNANKGQPILLAYNSQVTLSPKLTLPYPDLVVDGLMLRCAAEVLTQYEHPVLRTTLGEIVKKSELKNRIEFLMQGESLIAF